MKKLLLLLSFVTILSCSSSDDNSNNNDSNSKFHPPAWIQGTWGIKASPSQGIPEQAFYKFESDNLCQLTGGITSICWKEALNTYKNVNTPSLIAEDTTTPSTYEARFGAGGSVVTLKFERISATQIKWTNTGIGIDYIYDKLK